MPGAAGIPQIVAPGCYDLVDFVGWQAAPAKLADQEVHAHNRLLSSVLLDADQRREVARAICERLAQAKGPVVFLLPLHGCNEWDRPGAPLCDPDGLAAFIDEMRAELPGQRRAARTRLPHQRSGVCGGGAGGVRRLGRSGRGPSERAGSVELHLEPAVRDRRPSGRNQSRSLSPARRRWSRSRRASRANRSASTAPRLP